VNVKGVALGISLTIKKVLSDALPIKPPRTRWWFTTPARELQTETALSVAHAL